MAGYKDDIYAEIDQQFVTMGSQDRFADYPVEDPTPFEQPFTPIEPIGWVENANSNTGDGEATVRIDANGITITEGSLTFVDRFGSTVLTGAGFGTSWYDFIQTSVYNFSFSTGTTTALTAATKVNSAATIADYDASLSDDIPHWIIDSVTSTNALNYVAREAADASGSGFILVFRKGHSSDMDATVFQDIPVLPGRRYMIRALHGIPDDLGNSGTTTKTLNISGSFRDKDHALLDAAENTAFDEDVDYIDQSPGTHSTLTTLSPDNARFLRVRVKGTITGTGTYAIGASAISAEVVPEVPYYIYDYVTGAKIARFFESGGTQGIEIGSGDAYIAGSGDVIYFGDPGLSTTAQIDESASNLSIGTIDSAGIITSGGQNVFSNGNAALTLSGGGFIVLTERSDPASPAANGARFYVRDNGSGKTQLVVRFATGAIQVIATQP